MNSTILVVDDELDILEFVGYNLRKEGYIVLTANNGLTAIEIAQEKTPDLVILDVMMPDMDGIETCERMRAIPKLTNTIITFLTARSEDYSQIAGLEAGADDYITKPFEPRELILRIQRILARQKRAERPSLIQFGSFSYDTDRQVLMENGRRVHITTAEQDLLQCFTAAPNTVLSRQDISDSLLGRMKGRSIDVAVARMRTKLEGDPRFPVFLQTVRGKGWMLRTN